MFEKIENVLNKGGRKQRGKNKLKSRVNITYPQKTLALVANIEIEMKLEQFKQLKSDLTKLLLGEFKIIFTVSPNKPFTKKGILVRMGKGKGKIDHFSCKITRGTICVILVPKLNDGDLETIKPKLIAKLSKYPFLSLKIHTA